MPHISEMQEQRIRAQAENLVGREYDWAGIIFWFVFPVFKQSNRRWWCSEICGFLLKDRNFRIDPNEMAMKYGAPKQ